MRVPAALHGRARRLWRRLRGWRRIRFTGAGVVFTVGACSVGFAAINTGNNLLYLLLGAMLGFIALSGWLSEQSIRGIRVTRSTPAGSPVDREVRITYGIHNHKRWIPTFAIEIGETELPGKAYVAKVPPRSVAEARAANRFVRRGVYPLDQVTLSTTFPFGLFLKERDIPLPGEVVVWPRFDRSVRPPAPTGQHVGRLGRTRVGGAGHRGEYRSLRSYRSGDDRRDIHWRRSARLTVPVLREYEVDRSHALWICLDHGAPPGDAAEQVLEVAASLAALSFREERRFGLVAGDRIVAPASGPGHFEAVLDALARTDFHPSNPPPRPPDGPARCVLVSLTGRGEEWFGDAYVGGAGGEAPAAERVRPFTERTTW